MLESFAVHKLLISTNYRLQWDEEKFGGVDVFRIDARKIWIPDIEVFNSAVRSKYVLTINIPESLGAKRDESCITILHRTCCCLPNWRGLIHSTCQVKGKVITWSSWYYRKIKVYCSEFNREVWPQVDWKMLLKQRKMWILGRAKMQHKVGILDTWWLHPESWHL